jgi:iron complex outermembrane recepter protein
LAIYSESTTLPWCVSYRLGSYQNACEVAQEAYVRLLNQNVGASVGNRLPFVPEWESSASADYKWRLFAEYSGFAGLSWRFTGNRDANFETAAARLQVPGFSIFDVRAGVEKNSWSFTLYAKNLGNKIAINYLTDEAFSGSAGPQSAVLYQPRTLGATVSVTF